MAPRNQREERRNTPAPTPLRLAIRQVGVDGISKQELNQITKDSGKSAGTVVQRLDQINKNLKENDKTGISLNSGAANMLIRQAGKQSPTGYNAYLNMLSGGSTFGSGPIGSVLQARASGTDLLGKQGNMMIGGTAIRPGGRETVRGFGKQYTYNGSGKGPYDGMELPVFNPDGAGPLAKPNPATWTDYKDPTTTNTNQAPTNQDPVITPTNTDPGSGPGMLSGGGMGAAGANKLGRAKSRLRKLGITGNVANQMGRGNVYRNLLNMF